MKDLRRKRRLAILVLLIAVAGAWRLAQADAPSMGHPAQAQLRRLQPTLMDSEAEHVGVAYIPGLGAVITLDLLRGPNSVKDKPSYIGVRDWVIYLMQTFGSQLSAVPSGETIAISVDFYDYASVVYHQLVVKSRAATAADAGSYEIWLDGMPYEAAVQKLGAPTPAADSRSTPQPTSAPARQPPGPTKAASDTGAATPASTPVSPADAAARIESLTLSQDFNTGQAVGKDWKVVNGNWVFRDGGYRQTELGKFDLITYYNRRLAGDLSLQVDMTYVQGEMGGGVVFNAPSSATKNGAPMVSFAGKGTYLQWGRFDEDGVFQYQGGIPVASVADGKPHTLAIRTSGASYSLSLDGRELAKGIPLNGATGGFAGLLASTSEMMFDNFKLESAGQP